MIVQHRLMLTPEDEDRAVTHVYERLTASFPDVEPAVVQDTVLALHAQFAGRPIRDFIPVLVERMARSSLLAGARPAPLAV